MEEARHAAQSNRSLAVVLRIARQTARPRDDNGRRSIRHRGQRAGAESVPQSKFLPASSWLAIDRAIPE